MSDWKEELRMADVDVDDAIATFGNKESRYVKYMMLFLEDDNYRLLIEAVKEGKCKEAFEYCHALKGIVGNLGFKKMFTNIYDACELLRAGRLEGVLELVMGVEDNYNRIIAIIKEM